MLSHIWNQFDEVDGNWNGQEYKMCLVNVSILVRIEKNGNPPGPIIIISLFTAQNSQWTPAMTTWDTGQGMSTIINSILFPGCLHIHLASDYINIMLP